MSNNLNIKKSLLKTVSYRILGSLTSFFIGYASTGNFLTGVAVGAADLLIKPAIYFAHELLWEKISKK